MSRKSCVNEFEELKDLIGALTMSEKKDIINKLNLKYDGNVNGKSLRVFNEIIKDPNITLERYSESFKDEINYSSFKKLLVRMGDKIIESFLLDENIKSNNNYDKRAVDIFSLEKHLLISEIMRYRGLFILADRKLNKVISLCKEYEHYDILLYALDKRRRWGIGSLSDNSLKQLEIEYTYFQKCKNAVKQSHEIYSRIIKNHTGFKTEVDIEFLNNSIAKLKIMQQNIDSKHLNYYMFYVTIERFNRLGKYNDCLVQLNNLLDFMEENDSVYSKSKYGNALLNKGIFYRMSYLFDNSIQSFFEAKKYFNDSPQNNRILCEQLTLSYLFSGNISKASYYLSLIKIDNKYSEENHIYMVDYYRLVVNFIKRDFRENLKLFAVFAKNLKPFNFNFEVRILEIMNLVELNNYDLADTCIEKLKKYVSRYRKSFTNYERINFISKLLSTLSSNSYNYKLISNLVNNDIISLSENQKTSKFNDYEMIPFHEWFISKVKNVPYNHAEAMKRLKRINSKAN